ncbi:MAG: hypothetical protein ACRDX8_12325 [Acidimicrobiales bacterium]
MSMPDDGARDRPAWGGLVRPIGAWLLVVGAMVGVSYLAELIPVPRPSGSTAPKAVTTSGTVPNSSEASGTCAGAPYAVAAAGAVALIAQRPSPALGAVLDAALGAVGQRTGFGVVHLDVLDATDASAEVVVDAKGAQGSFGLAMRLSLGCASGQLVVIGANDVSPA